MTSTEYSERRSTQYAADPSRIASTGESAGTWVRVSSGAQDEANQVPEIMAHVGARGYHVARRYTLHDKSAYKGEQQESLNAMLADMANGVITVLVVWHSDRLDRRGPKFAWATLAAAELAGGRIESVKDPEFGGDSIADELVTTVRMSMAKDESRKKSARNMAARETIHGNGGLDGKPPWGFEKQQGEKLNRPLVPTDEAREYVPRIYARVIAGQSLQQVSTWLNEQGVAPTGIRKEREDNRGKSGKWWPRTIGKLVRNPVYMGFRVNGNGQTTATYDPPLVDAATWAAAGRSLDERPKRGPIVKENRAYLSGAARCWRCGGPLYKLRAWGGKEFLRCSGTGPGRQACTTPANMMRLDTAEALADKVVGSLRNSVYGITVVPGNGPQIAAELARLDFERKQVAMRGLTWDAEDAERTRIRAEWEAVNGTPRTPDHREILPTGESYGAMWKRFSVDERADFLRSEVRLFYLQGEMPLREDAEVTDGKMEFADAVLDGVSVFLVWVEDQDQED